MNRRFAGPLAASVAGHGAGVALLLAFAAHLPPLPPPPEPRPIEIMLAAAPPPPAEPKPPPVKEAPPPEPPPPIVKQEPPPLPPPVVKEAPPPPRPRSRPMVTRRPPPVRETRQPPPVPYRPPVEWTAPAAPPQTAAIPPPHPAGPVVSAAYRGALFAWIERHKYYPEEARQRGEAGQGVLRFHVNRSGRVLDYAVVKSTGHHDLDAAIDRMMQGARLPPFPADMTASDIEVSVAIHFALAR